MEVCKQKLFSSVLGHSCFLQCWGTAVFFSVLGQSCFLQCWDRAVFFNVGTQLVFFFFFFFFSFFSVGTAVFLSVGTQLFFSLQCWDTAVFFSVGAQPFSSVSGHFSNRFNTKQQELGHWQLPKMLHQKDTSRRAVRK